MFTFTHHSARATAVKIKLGRKKAGTQPCGF